MLRCTRVAALASTVAGAAARVVDTVVAEAEVAAEMTPAAGAVTTKGGIMRVVSTG